MKRFHILLAALLAWLISPSVMSAPAGALDPTFADGGVRAIPFNRGGNLSDQGWATFQAPDGRIYMAGSVAFSGQGSGIGIARLLPDGQFDASLMDGMGLPGRASYLPPDYSNAEAYAITVLENGRIIVAGSARPMGSANDKLMVCMFDSTGAVVSGFGAAPHDGCAMLDVGASGEASLKGLVLDPQGNIVASGHASIGGKDRALLARLYRSGALIESFGTAGIRFPEFGDPDAIQSRLESIALSPEGKLISVGNIRHANSDSDFLVARFNWVTGALDNGFYDGFGYQEIDFQNDVINDDFATDVVVLDDNSIVVAGNTELVGGNHRPAIARLKANGGFIAGFGGSALGRPIYPACDFCSKKSRSIMRLPNGHFAIAGSVGIEGLPPDQSNHDLFVLHLDGNGIRVPGYGSDQNDVGTSRIDITPDDVGVGVLAQGDRILVVGHANYGGTNGNDFIVARLDHGLDSIPGNVFTITPHAGINGAVEPIMQQQVLHSGYKDFKVTPDDGFAVAGITGTCPGSLIGDQYFVGPVTLSCQFVVNFAADVTLTYLAGDNGTIEGEAQQTIPYNGNGEIVVAAPAEGYQLLAWSDGFPGPVRQDMEVTQSIEVTATFVRKSYNVVAFSGEGGTTSPAGLQEVLHGDNAAFTIQPDKNFGVGGITSNCEGALVGNLYITAPIVADCTIDIQFVPSSESYSLAYAGSESCAITGDSPQSVVSGHDGSPVFVEPDSGHFFVQWSDGSTANPRTDTHVFTDIDVAAVCATEGTDVHTVTPKPGAGGVLVPPLPQNVPHGGTAEFNIQPNPGFVLVGVEGCGGVRVGDTFVTGAIEADCDVTATFAPSDASFTLDYTAGEDCSLQGSVHQVVPAGGTGEPVLVTAQPGSVFLQWSDGWKETGRVDAHVFENMAVAAQCVAEGTPIHVVTTEVVAGNGAFDPLGDHLVADGQGIAFDLVPGEGHVIGPVSGCGGQRVGSTYTTGSIAGDCHIQASFIASDEQFLLTYLAEEGMGTISGLAEQVVVAGGTGEFVEALPLPGLFFVQWSDGMPNPLRQDANVTGDITVTANFALDGTPVYLATPQAGPGGKFIPDTAQQVAAGASAQFQVVPDPGFAVASVSGCGVGNFENGVYTTAPMVADCVVEATFFNDRIFYDGFQANPDD